MGMDVSASFGAARDSVAMFYHNKEQFACNSMEQIFSPVQIVRGNRGNPSSATPGLEPVLGVIDENGPFSGASSQAGAVGPTRLELDPYFSEAFGASESYNSCITNTDFILMINDGYDARNEVQGGELNIRKVKDRNEIQNVRVNALRGPLLVSGWGFDLEGKPARATEDGGNAPAGGPEGTYGDRTNWCTGPVNLIWDKQRQVWQGGQQIVCGKVTGTVSPPNNVSADGYTSFELEIFGGGSGTVQCHNHDPHLDLSDADGDIFMVAIRVGYEWIPIYSGGYTDPDQAAGQSATNDDFEARIAALEE